MFEAVNELAVLVSAMLSVAVGSIWYSPLLFGRVWLKSANLTIHDEELSAREAVILTCKGVVSQSVFFFFVAYLLIQIQYRDISLVSFGVVLLTLLLSSMISLIIWERRNIQYFLIHAGYGIISLISGVSIIVFWPW